MNQPESKSPLRFLPPIARILMGLVFFVFGLNGFLHFIPEPKEGMPAGAMALKGGFKASGYMLPLISGTETLAGALLLINCFVPLALVIIAPVIVNIMAFHIFLMPAPQAFAPGIIVFVLELYLAWSYRRVFTPMLACKVKPGSAS
jgi:uncharacterized membrane protein YphA (DoxX/SURF4 family)